MKMESLKVIEKVARKLAPGRSPTFTEVHIIKALETISGTEAVGRIKLSKMLGLGEGATRTLVKHLRSEGIVEILRSGIVLSDAGRKLLSVLRSKIGGEAEVPKSSLTVGSFNVAVLARDMADSVTYGLEQRDAAIKAGASGATTLVFSHNGLAMPGIGEDVFQNIESIHDMLISELKPKENDVIIIGSADDRLTAEFGAKAAVLELLKSKKR
jgi:predicted transcriptional regulator